jgi:hypothetical protein
VMSAEQRPRWNVRNPCNAEPAEAARQCGMLSSPAPARILVTETARVEGLNMLCLAVNNTNLQPQHRPKRM